MIKIKLDNTFPFSFAETSCFITESFLKDHNKGLF